MASDTRNMLPILSHQKGGQVTARNQQKSNSKSAEVANATLRDHQEYVQKLRQMQLDCLPQEMMFVLSSAHSNIAEPPSASTNRGLTTTNKTRPSTELPPKKRTDNLWYFSKQRDRWKHLLQSPVCLCGAGKDISFLYEKERPKAEKELESSWPVDPSAVRLELAKKQKKEVELPDTLIPEEYQLVKSRGVLGLEYHADKYGMDTDDHEKHLVVFPSLNPNSRYEAQLLEETIDDMLKRAGIDEGTESIAQTQMHNLLEVIKKEQDIYNVIFHELIRQVSVDCIERGRLLANIRHRYAELFSKVPQQIESLHNEMLAQRAVDRRLTEELVTFKTTVQILTNELTEVKQLEKRVRNEALKAQEELAAAVEEARRNADLLSEYHDLYELQRQRLEKHVGALTEEKDLWSTTAYSLALKVISEKSLSVAKRLHVSEKAWSKMARHFALMLGDHETESLGEIQKFVADWRDAIESLDSTVSKRESQLHDSLKKVGKELKVMLGEFLELYEEKDGIVMKSPDKAATTHIVKRLKQMHDVLMPLVELFGGEAVLSLQESLSYSKKLLRDWTDVALRICARHQDRPRSEKEAAAIEKEKEKDAGKKKKKHGKDNEQAAPPSANPAESSAESKAFDVVRESIQKLTDTLGEFMEQLATRLLGENGTAKAVIDFSELVEAVHNKFATSIYNDTEIRESDWIGYLQALHNWPERVSAALKIIGTSQLEKYRLRGKPHTPIDLNQAFASLNKWASSFLTGIQSEDMILMEQVIGLHREMIKWMIQVLLRLAPTMPTTSNEADEFSLQGTLSLNEIQQRCQDLSEQLASFTKYLDNCCGDIVVSIVTKKQEMHEENSDFEQKELQRLQTEASEWIATAQLLTSEVMQKPAFFEPSSVREGGRQQSATPASGLAATSAPRSQSRVPSSGVSPELGSSRQAEAYAAVRIQQLGPDANTYMKTVQQDPTVNPQEQLQVTEGLDTSRFHPSQLQPDALDMAALANLPDADKTYIAMMTVEKLQRQLLETEQRAQHADERAVSAELQVAEMTDKIRLLEEKVGRAEAQIADLLVQVGDAPPPVVVKPPEPKTDQQKKDDELIAQLIQSRSPSRARTHHPSTASSDSHTQSRNSKSSSKHK